jgi:hypothetical protein
VLQWLLDPEDTPTAETLNRSLGAALLAAGAPDDVAPAPR